jgi:hypothetical protein
MRTSRRRSSTTSFERRGRRHSRVGELVEDVDPVQLKLGRQARALTEAPAAAAVEHQFTAPHAQRRRHARHLGLVQAQRAQSEPARSIPGEPLVLQRGVEVVARQTGAGHRVRLRALAIAATQEGAQHASILQLASQAQPQLGRAVGQAQAGAELAPAGLEVGVGIGVELRVQAERPPALGEQRERLGLVLGGGLLLVVLEVGKHQRQAEAFGAFGPGELELRVDVLLLAGHVAEQRGGPAVGEAPAHAEQHAVVTAIEILVARVAELERAPVFQRHALVHPGLGVELGREHAAGAGPQAGAPELAAADQREVASVGPAVQERFRVVGVAAAGERGVEAERARLGAGGRRRQHRAAERDDEQEHDAHQNASGRSLAARWSPGGGTR